MCDKDPEVAVTATDEEKEWKLEPQPFAEQRASTTARNMKIPRRFLRRRKPGTSRQRAKASEPPETRRSIADDELLALPATLIHRALESGDPAGVRVAGEKAHVTPAGGLAQVKVMGALKPLSGAMVMLVAPSEPCWTLSEELLRAKLKSVLVSVNCAVPEKPETEATTV